MTTVDRAASTVAPGRSPNGPRGRWLVGNAYDYERDRIGFLRRCQSEYGDAFRFSASTMVMLHPEHVHELFMRTNGAFRQEDSLFVDERHSAHLAETVPDELSARRKGWKGMNKASTAAYADRVHELFDNLLDRTAGREVEVLPVMQRWSAEMAVDYCLGSDGADVSEIAGAIDLVTTQAVVHMGRPAALPSWLPLPSVRRTRAANETLRALLRERIDRRPTVVRSADRAPDFLDVLLSGHGGDLGTDAVLDMLTMVLKASHGASGTALTWAVRELALRPGLSARLTSEAAGPDRPFTTAFVMELLRYYPPMWLLGRYVDETTTVGGWQLRAGQEVMFSPYLSHHDERWWDRPDEFRPQRWLDDLQPHARYAYYPWGAGPRICLGNQLGMVQLVTCVSVLASRWRTEVPNAAEAPMDFQAFLTPRGLRARFTRVAGH